MKQQTSLSMTGFFDKGKKTRRERFLAEMEQVVPWARLCAVIEPHYPKGSPRGGRPPLPLERMFRIYCLQQWYNLSDPAAEEAPVRLDHGAPVCGGYHGCGCDSGRDVVVRIGQSVPGATATDDDIGKVRPEFGNVEKVTAISIKSRISELCDR